ncbi:phosphodiester glycosidase family protein [Spirulina subsalsa FACHB-351]|uniref:Phosphodiester glycosidase family protein n=1 Tax=Spirulina subsalsa FACHB-351 TaxID=234711 RepID=A0ABT3L2Q1_9CYAN|nr:phosphodiester glycosidase family protein [Spirulina subsalsa]MCW6035793.1 phosphodiester glycosidase family protein [Spirulina subsalsa FACHB-351]
MVGLTVPLLLHLALLGLRPPRRPNRRELFVGVMYERLLRKHPRPVVIHVVSFDLREPSIQPFVTLGQVKPQKMQFPAQTTGDFVRQYPVAVAINGSFFTPAYARHPWDYFPKRGDRVYAIGQVIANGVLYSPPHDQWAVLCFIPPHTFEIVPADCPEGTTQAIAGRDILLDQGKTPPLIQHTDHGKNYPRSAIALNPQQKKLWFVVVDGRQPFYSQGMTLPELSQFLAQLGATEALNLDGGGSSTLVIREQDQIITLNSPIHTRIPLRQRPVATHLGFSALPLERDNPLKPKSSGN